MLSLCGVLVCKMREKVDRRLTGRIVVCLENKPPRQNASRPCFDDGVYRLVEMSH